MRKRLTKLTVIIVAACLGQTPLLGSTLTTVDVASGAMGKKIPVSVIMPDAYTQNDERRFPVLYLLHGAGDTNSKWPRRTRRFAEEIQFGEALRVVPFVH